jgi:hypothetical protein
MKQREGMTMWEAAIASGYPPAVEMWRQAEGVWKIVNELNLRIPLRLRLGKGEWVAQGFRRMRLVNIPQQVWWGYCSVDLEAETVRDREGNCFAQVRILPVLKPEGAAVDHRDLGQINYECAVDMYREHYRAHGRDRGDPATKSAPTEKEDVALADLLFGGVPEKTLAAMRRKVWGNLIKRGRPRKLE